MEIDSFEKIDLKKMIFTYEREHGVLLALQREARLKNLRTLVLHDNEEFCLYMRKCV